MRKIQLIRSEGWMGDDFEVVNSVLERTIKEMVPKDHDVINVQVVERNGNSRFWIYAQKKLKEPPTTN